MVVNLLAVILLPICVFYYFAFNEHFDGCPVPYDETIERQDDAGNKRKGGKKNA